MKRLFFTIALLAGCANPKYVTPGEGAAAGEQKATGDQCAAYFKNGGCVAWKFEVRGTPKTFSTILLKTGRENLGDGTFLPEDPAGPLEIIVSMPEMGHDSSPVRIARVDVGTFRVTKVSLPHNGLYEFHIRVMNGDATANEAVIRYTP